MQAASLPLAWRKRCFADCFAQLIIDGVGFPSVGSIVGVDNADVAKAAKAPVLLVCNLP